MTDVFDRLMTHVLGNEGGYANHPDDRGGETNWGVTVGVARQFGYAGAMRAMTRDQAVAIYRARFWVKPGFDQISRLSERVAGELFDTGVNMGPAVAATMLQRALNALNRQGKDYPDLKADGDIGPATRAALAAFLRVRGGEGEVVLLKALNVLQGERYIALAEGRPANESFVYGWLRTRVEIAA
ncbi:MAG TPA: glycosyl hydrolase 108 family protein [Brevundimonas sp.]|nr:glycosyl hydrolase 108 family protein [Brevundimonas sp.]